MRATPSLHEPIRWLIPSTASCASIVLRKNSSYCCSASELLGGAEHLDEAVEVGVGIHQDDVELLDAAVLLRTPEDAERIVEDLEGTFLRAAYGLAPADEEDAVGHADLLQLRPGPSPGLSD